MINCAAVTHINLKIKMLNAERNNPDSNTHYYILFLRIHCKNDTINKL